METKLVIIFDVDGTLVDVSQSYKLTDLLTSYIYADMILGIKDLPSPEDWFTVNFIDDLKEMVGFNNDYTCTAVLLDFFLSIISPTRETFETLPFSNVSYNKLGIKSLNGLKQSWDEYLQENYKDKEKRPELILEKSKWKDFIKNKGSLRGENLLERIFQEVYYGSTKFTEYFDLQTKFFTSEKGFFTKEKLLIPEELLKELHSKNILLGICTGRPRKDLDLFIEMFSLDNYFSKELIITLTDVQAEEERLGSKERLSKPHPWPLIELKRRLGNNKNKILMIGDSKDDLLSAEKSGIVPVLFSNSEKNLQIGINYEKLISWNGILEIIKDL